MLAVTTAFVAGVLLAAPAGANHGPAQLVTAGPAGALGEDTLRGITPDGEHAYFATPVAVLPGDTDVKEDLYHRFNGVTELISTGPIPESMRGAEDDFPSLTSVAFDGSRAFFATEERLVSEDFDLTEDVYSRFGAVTRVESIGPVSGSFPFDVSWGGSTRDGTRLFFETQEPLVAGDNQDWDVFERNGATTSMVAPPGGDGIYGAFLAGLPHDDGRVFFSARDAITADDHDDREDIYEKLPEGTIRLRTQDHSPGDPSADAYNAYNISPDGARIIFVSYERLTSDDQDNDLDVYENVEGITSLVSTMPGRGANDVPAYFSDASEDGGRVFFVTEEPLAPEDANDVNDIYEHGPEGTRLVSGGVGPGLYDDVGMVGASADGSRVFFISRPSLVAQDTDASWDVYERSNGEVSLVSTGPAGGNAEIPATSSARGISRDGKRAFFQTAEALVSADTDSAADVYEWLDGQISLVSVGPGGNGALDATFLNASHDGSRVFFRTAEPLVAEDGNAVRDVYVAKTSGTADLSVTQTAVPDPVLDANPVTYTITVTNDTSSPVGGVTLINSLPTGVTFDTATTPGGHCSRSWGTVGCTLPALGGHESATVEITVRAKNAPRPLTNKAVVRSFETDVDYADNVSLHTPRARPRSPSYPRPGGAAKIRVPLMPVFAPCDEPNREHAPPLAIGSCEPARLESSVLTWNNARDAPSIRMDVIAGDPTTPEDEADVAFFIRPAMPRCVISPYPGCDPTGAYRGQLLVRIVLRITDLYNGPLGVEPATVQDTALQYPVRADMVVQTTAEAMVPDRIVEEKRSVMSVHSIDMLDPGPNGTGFTTGCPPTCGDGDESLFATQGLFVP